MRRPEEDKKRMQKMIQRPFSVKQLDCFLFFSERADVYLGTHRKRANLCVDVWPASTVRTTDQCPTHPLNPQRQAPKNEPMARVDLSSMTSKVSSRVPEIQGIEKRRVELTSCGPTTLNLSRSRQ